MKRTYCFFQRCLAAAQAREAFEWIHKGVEKTCRLTGDQIDRELGDEVIEDAGKT